MAFKSASTQSKWEGLLVCALIILLDLLLLRWMLGRPVDTVKFILIVLLLASVPPLAHLIYRTLSLFTLEYWVDRNAITIVWAGMQQVIPLNSVQRIIQGQVEDLSRPGWRQWPALHIRKGNALGMLNLQLFATRPLEDCLLLDVGDAMYAVSPAQTEHFLETVQGRYKLGPAIHVKAGEQHLSLLPRLWQRMTNQDRIGSALILLGVVGLLALFGVLMVRFPELPTDLVFRYNPDGLPERISNKSALFLLPSIGLLTWIVNLAWGAWMASRNQRIGAYMLWGGAVIVQLFSFMALIRLMR